MALAIPRRLIFTLALLLLPAWAFALSTISGKVLDRETGESIPSAAVMVVGTLRGAAADVEGLFSIPDLPAGSVQLKVSALGYQSQNKTITLEDGPGQHLTFKLVPEAVQLLEVNVETEATKEREYTPQVAQYTMPTRQLAALPQVIEADLFRSLQIMPGVLSTSDFSSDLNIWGGSSDQNLILLNGIDVYKPMHLGGLFSVFNMDAVKDVKLIKGGFGAKYGGRLSAVVDVADREGNRNKPKAKLGVSLLSSNATLEGPLPHGSWLVAGRRTYLDWATKTMAHNGIISDAFPYYFYDLNAKVTRDFSNGDRISPSTYMGRDVLSLVSNTNDRIIMSWGNTTYSLPFVHVWSHKLFSTTTVAGSYFDSRFHFETSGNWFEYQNRINDFTIKSDYSWFASAHHTLDYGVLAKNLAARFFIGGPNDTLVNIERNGWQAAAYVADDYRVTDTWTVSPGLRLEHNGIGRTTDLLPRLAVKKELDKSSSVSAAWGMYTQYLQLVSMGTNMLSLFDSYIPLDRSMKPNRGQQLALSYEYKFENGIKFTTDTYYKRFTHLIELKKNQTTTPDNASRPLSDYFDTGDGNAYGWDIFCQGQWREYSFMLGYALGRADRGFSAYDNPDAYPVGAGKEFPTSFDRLHNTNLFVSRPVGKHGTLEMRFNYGSGQGVTPAIAAYSPGLGLPPHALVPGEINGHRVPDYHRLDVAYRLRYEYKRWTFAPYLEVINLYNHQNVLTYTYDMSQNPVKVKETYQLPLLPSIGFTAEF